MNQSRSSAEFAGKKKKEKSQLLWQTTPWQNVLWRGIVATKIYSSFEMAENMKKAEKAARPQIMNAAFRGQLLAWRVTHPFCYPALLPIYSTVLSSCVIPSQDLPWGPKLNRNARFHFQKWWTNLRWGKQGVKQLSGAPGVAAGSHIPAAGSAPLALTQLPLSMGGHKPPVPAGAAGRAVQGGTRSWTTVTHVRDLRGVLGSNSASPNKALKKSNKMHLHNTINMVFLSNEITHHFIMCYTYNKTKKIQNSTTFLGIFHIWSMKIFCLYSIVYFILV